MPRIKLSPSIGITTLLALAGALAQATFGDPVAEVRWQTVSLYVFWCGGEAPHQSAPDAAR